MPCRTEKPAWRLHGLHWASFEALEASSFGGTFHMGQRTHWNASVVCPLPLGRKFESFKPHQALSIVVSSLEKTRYDMKNQRLSWLGGASSCLWSRPFGVFWLPVSGAQIPFPGNRDFGFEETGSNRGNRPKRRALVAVSQLTCALNQISLRPVSASLAMNKLQRQTVAVTACARALK